MVSEYRHWLQLQVTSCKGVRLSSEALKSGIGFFSLAMKVLDGILLLTEGCFFLHWKSLYGEATLTISGRSSETGASSSALAASPWTFMLWRWLPFLEPHEPTSVSFKLIFCSFPFLFSLHWTEETGGPCSGLGFGLRGMLWFIGSSIQATKTFIIKATRLLLLFLSFMCSLE